MSEVAAISYAILMINEDENKDFHDNFVPMIAECIRVSSSPYISANEVQRELSERFGLKIPINVIDTILRKKIAKLNLIIKKDRKFIPNREILNALDFSSKQEKVLEQHDKLIDSLLKFSKKYSNVNWDKGIAEGSLEKYLKKNNLLLLNINNKNIDTTSIEERESSIYIVGQFVKNLEVDSIEYRYFESIVKGDMLANAIYYTDPAHSGMKFKNNTEIYFDTTFLIYSLGYTGEPRQAPCLELIQLLKESKAMLRCFKHTVEEIIGILEGCQIRLKSGNIYDNHGTMEYFLENNFTPADIERIIYSIEDEITNKLKIKVVERPEYIEQYTIDEKLFSNTLKQSIKYNNELALDRDVYSVSSIMLKRKNKRSLFIEDCGALFVTTNPALAEVSRRYFNKGMNSRFIPPVLPNYVLTNLLWLKNPTSAPDLTRKRIIADCIASTSTPEYVWEKYYHKINELNRNGSITSDEYFLLRYSMEARRTIMEVTSGSVKEITIGTIEEILTISKKEMTKEYIEITEQRELQAEKAQMELEEYKKQVASTKVMRQKRIILTTEKVTLWSMRFIKVMIVIFLLVGQTIAYYTSSLSIPLFIHIPVLLIFGSFFPIASYLGLSLLKPFEKIESAIFKFIERKFTEWFNPTKEQIE